MNSRPGRAAAALVLAAALAGCGKERGGVSGKVTLQGQPVSEGEVQFYDREWGAFMTAKLNADGSYVVRTADGPGLWVGTYQVAIVPAREDPPLGSTAPPAPKPFKVPPKYWDPKTSGLKITVEDSNRPFDFDLSP
jgi:hypothetical protein